MSPLEVAIVVVSSVVSAGMAFYADGARRKLNKIERSLRMADHWLGSDFIRPGDVIETECDDIRLRGWQHVREALAVIDPKDTGGLNMPAPDAESVEGVVSWPADIGPPGRKFRPKGG